MDCQSSILAYAGQMLKAHCLILPLISSLLPLHAQDDPTKILRFSTPMVTMSAVQGKGSLGTKLVVENTGNSPVDFAPAFVGKDAVAFSMEPSEAVLEAGEKKTFVVQLSPVRGAGGYEAGLDVSEGRIPVRGIGLRGFEGSHEPPLDRIVAALGIPIDVGSSELSLNTEADIIGESIPAGKFLGVTGTPVRITPVARFSPPGELSYGIVSKAGKQIEWGTLDASDEGRPDNHQCLFPWTQGGQHMLEEEAPKDPFSLYIKGHIFTSFTDPAQETTAPVKHTARVYPVKKIQGRDMENAYLIAFEESQNGDYQDAVFLLENVTAQ